MPSFAIVTTCTRGHSTRSLLEQVPRDVVDVVRDVLDASSCEAFVEDPADEQATCGAPTTTAISELDEHALARRRAADTLPSGMPAVVAQSPATTGPTSSGIGGAGSLRRRTGSTSGR